MIQIRPANERGHANHGWLDSRHSFSFGNYYDPQHMGFRTLRVLNDDIVQPGQGFGTHGHRDMEIVSYVLEGALAHRDSMGTGSVLRPGDVQRMSAGRGVTHSEFNHSQTERLRFLQIWILPAEPGIEPGYEERQFSAEDKQGKLRLIVSPNGENASLHIHQDVRFYAGVLSPGERVSHAIAPGRHAWLQIARGRVLANGQELRHGDGAAISDVSELGLTAREECELLLIDLA
jgi:redox-sensitive bicupin YhaK (pirin superfamily)